jgi:hypothetical protein
MRSVMGSVLVPEQLIGHAFQHGSFKSVQAAVSLLNSCLRVRWLHVSWLCFSACLCPQVVPGLHQCHQNPESFVGVSNT